MASQENGKYLQDLSDPPQMHFSAGQSLDPAFVFIEREKIPPSRIARISVGQGGESREWIGTVEEFPDGGRETIDLRMRGLNSFVGNSEATGCLMITSKGRTETTIIRKGEIVYRDPIGNGHSSQLVPQLDFFSALDNR